jgi:transcriptional regulator with XRE-family HTH domain
MFALVGETVRRLRKQRGLTLAQLGAQAKLGRGQLSRIENAHQEATFSTMGKILGSLGVSRSEFFRRYDLVEGEAVASKAGGPAPSEAEQLAPEQSGAVAQGTIELGDVVVYFRVVPKEPKKTE